MSACMLFICMLSHDVLMLAVSSGRCSSSKQENFALQLKDGPGAAQGGCR